MSSNPNDPYPWTGPFSQSGMTTPLHPSEAQKAYLPLFVPPESTPMTSAKPVNPGPVFGGVVMPAGQTLAGALGVDLLPNLVFVGVLWEVWVCLYPVAALAGFLTFAVVWPLLGAALSELGAAIIAVAAAAVVLWTMSRREHVWARSRLYRIPRHIIRLPLLGLATVALIELWLGLPYRMTPAAIRAILSVPANLALVAAIMVASHFILWNWTWGREFWHRRLVTTRLRKRDT
ncbi:MAG TPA: hypothetical protein VL993_02150 [Stellaceae bacterium]|nr:hypothetical protein [Stellaceae bacterium]